MDSLLTHEAAKALEGTRDAHVWVDLDEDTLGCMNVNLQQAGFVKRRVKESQQALF